jgi:hypothetical protein
MLTEQFYDLLDKELETIISEYEEDIRIKKLNQVNQQKSYALLIWFLKFYAPYQTLFQHAITDGKDDSSCDLIFKTREEGSFVYYVVQSKWNVKTKLITLGKESAKISSDEVKKAIIDFESVLKKDKKRGSNELFNQKLDELSQHLAEPEGKVKFIFLGLLHNNDNLNENINNFQKSYSPHIKLEIIDIERLKRDYIEFNYKKIKVENPLRYKYNNPEYESLNLPIERILDWEGKGDHLRLTNPYQSYMFFVKPKAIYELFAKYEFGLFFSNVRNPLPASNYNEAIVQTLLEQPDMFWYYNNGITAITKSMKPIGFRSESIELTGLQVINGAQTVYSIYEAYENAHSEQRASMNKDAKVALRLIQSTNQVVNLEITRYTNSQNPMEARDFWANDPIQIQLQEESFKTKYWYERRRGEFRTVPTDITVLNNEVTALSYLAFCEQKPVIPILKPNSVFKSAKNGIYNTVFNKEASFENLLASHLMWQWMLEYLKDFVKKSKKTDSLSLVSEELFEATQRLHGWLALALSKPFAEEYLKATYPNDNKNINIYSFINEAITQQKKDKINTLKRILIYSFQTVKKDLKRLIQSENENQLIQMERAIKEPSFYEQLRAQYLSKPSFIAALKTRVDKIANT